MRTSTSVPTRLRSALYRSPAMAGSNGGLQRAHPRRCIRDGGTAAWRPPLHARVVGAAAALRDFPHDVLLRVLDVAGLAVHAVLRVDAEHRLPAFGDDLVDGRGAIALRRLVVHRQVVLDGNRGVLELQVW